MMEVWKGDLQPEAARSTKAVRPGDTPVYRARRVRRKDEQADKASNRYISHACRLLHCRQNRKADLLGFNGRPWSIFPSGVGVKRIDDMTQCSPVEMIHPLKCIGDSNEPILKAALYPERCS